MDLAIGFLATFGFDAIEARNIAAWWMREKFLCLKKIADVGIQIIFLGNWGSLYRLG